VSRRIIVTALALLALGAPAAHASRGQESTFQDDNHLIYAPPDEVAATMDRMKALGADRLRITVLWSAIAPDIGSKQRPAGFDAADPGDYPHGIWDHYDTVVQLAAERGLGVNFNLTVPAPLWATGSSPRADIENRYAPNPSDFGDFVRAVGRRFPQVTYWSIQNEPNQAGWLDPQWMRSRGKWVEAAPAIYRGMADAAWTALQETGHGSDTILIGETAPKGVSVRGTTRAISPGRFIKRLYCLDDHLQMLKGTRATERGCPAGGSPAEFRAAHPVLFSATGYAHHPYELIFPPNRRPRHSDWYTTANLRSLSALLRRVRARFGFGGGIPLYLTEFGYQTDPPDPLGVTPREQARYLNQAEYLTYRNRRVRTLSQFLLYDDAAPTSATFQTGLNYLDGSAKPARAAYAFALFLPAPRVRHGRRLHVWGLLRAAPNGQAHRVDVLFRARGSRGRFHRIARLRSQAARGYVDGRVRVRRSGSIRLRWGAVRSRAAAFRVR
jgi:Cellulase (glycosyl hydrolase family 5)